MPVRVPLFLFVAVITILVSVLAVGALALVVRPTVEFDPNEKPFLISYQGQRPDQIVDAFVNQAGVLPPSGTSIERRGGVLHWTSSAGAAINGVEIAHVKLSGTSSILMTFLDDDPICVAEVDTTVTTVDGQQTALHFTLWDYGRLSPWSFRQLGDGWKLRNVTFGTVD